MTSAIASLPGEPYKSATQILGMFAVLLRGRFSYEETPQNFMWREDPTETGLFVCTYLDENQGTEVGYPKVTVGRGTMVSGDSSVGDQDQHNPELLKRGGMYFHRFVSFDVSIECAAETKGEAEALGDMVWATIEMGRHEICRAMTLRELSSVVLEPVRPMSDDQSKFVTRVGFRLQFEVRWYSVAGTRVLNAITASQMRSDAQTYIENFILRSGELPEP